MAGPHLDEELAKPLLGTGARAKEEHGIFRNIMNGIFQNEWIPSAIAVSVWISVGIFVGCILEGWHFLTAFYFMIQVVTTIGYGDVLVTRQGMKIFMAFYTIAAVMIIANIFSSLIEAMLSKQQHSFRKLMVEAKAGDGSTTNRNSLKQKRHMDEVAKVCFWFVLFLFFVLIGTIFYAREEACSCSYGHTFIKGCKEGPECFITGGAVKTWIDSFYMSVITLTTVGFGDHSPKTKLGRAFGCIWMLFGVIGTGQFVSTFSSYFTERKKMHRRKKFDELNADLFAKLDQDRSGKLSLTEFRTYALVKYELVSKDDLDHIDDLFKRMDKDGSGNVDLNEIQKFTDH